MKQEFQDWEIQGWYSALVMLKTHNFYNSTSQGTVAAVDSLRCVQLFTTSPTTACQDPLSPTISWSAQIHVHWVGDAI